MVTFSTNACAVRFPM